MIQFSQLLQQRPETIINIVKENINSPHLQSLIAERQFLQSLDFQLTTFEEVPFFIKHVFRIIRKPSQNQLQVLKQYTCLNSDQNVQNLIINLIQDSQKNQKGSIHSFFNNIRNLINNGQRKDLKALIGQSICDQFEPFKALVSLLFESKEDHIFSNNSYRNTLFESITLAFQILSKYQQYRQEFIDIIASLLKQKITKDSDYLFLLLIIINISQNYPNLSKNTIQCLNNKCQTKELSANFINASFFNFFQAYFKTKLYYDSKDITTFNQIVQIADKLYDLFLEDSHLAEMNWIVILSIKTYFRNYNDKQIQRFHTSVSLIRQIFFYEPEIVSELLILTICRIIEEIKQTDIQRLQDIISALTPKQIKYLILKLHQTLSSLKKKQIIFTIWKGDCKILQVMALYFCVFTQFQNEQKQKIAQFISIRRQRQAQISKEINQSRYHSLQKELENFNQRYLYIISRQLSLDNQHTKFQLSSQLSYYGKLLQNDQFSQQYWLNQQRITIFSYSYEPLLQKIDIVCQYINEKQVYNLSSLMIINQLLKYSLKNQLQNISQIFQFTINEFFKLASKILFNDFFPSNICIALEYILLILKLKLPIDSIKNIKQLLQSKNMQNYTSWHKYNRISYLCELIGITHIENNQQLQIIRSYVHILPFYRQIVCKGSFNININQFIQKVFLTYQSLKLIPQNSHYILRQIRAKADVRKMICHQMKKNSIKQNIKKIGEVFSFEMPIYKKQIVILTYLSHSPEDNYYFKNHFIPFLYQQYVRILSLACQKLREEQITCLIFQTCVDLLEIILNGDTFSHSESFYKSLNKTQIAYIFLTKVNLSYLSSFQIRTIIHLCLKIIQKDNYPLLRQYISIVLCRSYCVLNTKEPKNQMRKHFIQNFKHNVNIGVPLALILGYQLLQFCKSPQKIIANIQQIESIYELLVKFISCHTAYLRVICQYYLYQYIQSVPSQDPFLANIRKFWSEDKDSQKLFQNISIVIQGFCQGVQNKCDFLGFERVEQYPSNRVKLQIYGCLARFYNEAILNEIIQDKSSSSKFYKAICEAAIERHQCINNIYLYETNLFFQFQSERTIKSNIKRQNYNQNKTPQPLKKGKKQSKPKGKNKINPKVKAIEQIQKGHFQKDLEYILYNRFCQYEQIHKLSNWYRDNLDPKIIIVATLLQKVPNFGHILRTLHNKNAMLIVPSQIPLLHIECKQLIPTKCDVSIVEIKNRDLQKFIVLMKSLGYPLVALEQCSRSVTVQQVVFPQKFMLLLGNQRIGAPASLLNEGDILVQIPQIGKIRSLNVHVSMVICLWQYLCKQRQ